MTTMLRQVLAAFENAETTFRLDALSRDLGVDPATLDNMLAYWVRKGRIREVHDLPAGGCSSCGVGSECPFVLRMPTRYELVRGDDPEPEAGAACCPPCRH
jgi:hypothetical protein